MRAYLSTFRLRFKLETQYRGAALGGLVCQLFFAFILIALYRALYETRGQSIALSEVITYVWLQQACFRLLLSSDQELTQTIAEGGMAYHLCRPVSQYFYWYSRALAQKLVGCALRAAPMLLIASLLPGGWGIGAPASPHALLLFLASLVPGILCVCALDNIASGVTIHSLDPRGINSLLSLLMVTFSGNLLPLTLFPDAWQAALRFSPYTQLLDAPIRMYTGLLTGKEAAFSLLIQFLWSAALILLGVWIWKRNLKCVVVQGG